MILRECFQFLFFQVEIASEVIVNGRRGNKKEFRARLEVSSISQRTILVQQLSSSKAQTEMLRQ
jgi:hypothetical protein